MTLPRGFTLSEAPSSDHLDGRLWEMYMASYKTDGHWICITKDIVRPEEMLPYMIQNFVPRWTIPDITTYKITKDSTGKLVAWTALQRPWKYVPEMSEELKAHALSKDLPPVLDGMNVEAFIELFKALGGAGPLGYDPDNDYHRKGTFVHPDFQKRGFGTHMTQFCNDIADKTGDRTWVPARPSSLGMFRKMGFKDVEVVDGQLERWGGTRADSMTWIVLRDPPQK